MSIIRSKALGLPEPEAQENRRYLLSSFRERRCPTNTAWAALYVEDGDASGEGSR